MDVTTTRWERLHDIPDETSLSQESADMLVGFLTPLLQELDVQLDRRLVNTLLGCAVGLLSHRGRDLCLLLTELGEQLTDGAHASAGVRRIWRLLKSPKWSDSNIHEWMIKQADQAVEQAYATDGQALLPLDGSVAEKPNARKLEGLTNVRSAQARLLQRSCGGPPPKRPTFVPGFNWVSAVVTGMTGTFTLARLHWYSSKAPGDQAQHQREAEQSVLWPLLDRWGSKVICLLDRGFDSHPFLGQLLARSARFIVRWRSDFHLIDAVSGEEKAAGQLTIHLRSQGHVLIHPPKSRQAIKMGVASLPVRLPDCPNRLSLVVARRQGKTSLWLLTNEPVTSVEQATRIAQMYARRWQVEWAFRYQKTDLGFASIRVRKWDYRQKLWAIAELAHAFLLRLIATRDELVAKLLRWCDRNGRKNVEVIAPTYRLRHALCNVWNDHPPTLGWLSKCGM
jgi:hypothetical protein